MDLEKIKQFYLETLWLWGLYLVAWILAVWFISPVFLMALPILIAISLYFAIIRGPSKQSDQNSPNEDHSEES